MHGSCSERRNIIRVGIVSSRTTVNVTGPASSCRGSIASLHVFAVIGGGHPGVDHFPRSLNFLDDFIEFYETESIMLFKFEHFKKHLVNLVSVLLLDQHEFLKERFQAYLEIFIIKNEVKLLLENHLDKHNTQGKYIRFLN